MKCGEMVCTQCVPSMLALEGKYPEKPLFEVGESKESSERQEHDGYTEQEIKEAREALVMQLQIMEGQQRRAKRKKELFEH